MILAPMRFCGYTWKYNPHTIKILSKKEIKENKIPFSDSVIQNFGRIARVIKGEGCIFGSDCFARYDELWRIYSSNKRGILSVPDFAVMEAEFVSLEIIGEPTDKLIKYSFVFTEIMNTKRNRFIHTEHITKSAENFFTIANLYDISVDRLMTLNPEHKNPFDIYEGDVIMLC